MYQTMASFLPAASNAMTEASRSVSPLPRVGVQPRLKTSLLSGVDDVWARSTVWFLTRLTRCCGAAGVDGGGGGASGAGGGGGVAGAVGGVRSNGAAGGGGGAIGGGSGGN